MFGYDHAALADERIGPVRRGLREQNADGEWIELLDLDILVAADRCRCRSWVGGILPIEHDIIGGELPAVVPGYILSELPGHRHAVGGQPAVFEVRDLGSEHRHQVAFGIPCRERLVENARPFLVLCADREMRVEQGSGLPEQHLERSAAARLGGFVPGVGRRLRQAGASEKLCRKRCGQTQTNDLVDEGAAGHSARLHRRYRILQFVLVHRTLLPPISVKMAGDHVLRGDSFADRRLASALRHSMRAPRMKAAARG